MLTTGSNIYDQCNVEGYDFSYNNIVAVEAGNRNTLGLKNYGQIVAAGSDVDTILLLDTRDKKIVAADSGDGFVSALYEDGTVESSSSRQDLDGNDFIAVTCGESVTLGLSADGKVVSSKEYYADEISKWNLLSETPASDVSQPPPTQSQPEDYLSDEALRDDLKIMSQEYDFMMILETADMYIEATNPAKTDSVFIIKEEAQAAEDAMYDVSIVADDSHNIIRYDYDGVDGISSVDNLYPYIEDEELTALAGFYQPILLIVSKPR